MFHLTRSACPSLSCPLPTWPTATMAPGVQAPFFLVLLLFPVLKGEGHKVGRGLPCTACLWVLFPGRWHPMRQKLQTGVLLCARKKEKG